jgi:type IV pilus assembly protein PilA
MINRTKKAFTLLELIVVLLVLGILAAIAVPTFNTVKTNSAKRSAQTTAEGIARNADAIAASSGSGDAVSGVELNISVGEADVADMTGWDTDGTDLAYTTTISGNAIVCTFSLGSLTASTSVVCA